MSRESSNGKAWDGVVIDTTLTEDFALPGVADSYQNQVRARTDLQRPAHGEMPGAAERFAHGVAEQALPAWIKTQVEQLEMRRKARHLLEKPGLSHGQEGD